MATIRRFEELECWKEGRVLVNLVYELTRKARFSKDMELSRQAVRSAISIMANITEGFHRNSNKEFLRFLDYSRSSAAETLSHCYIAYDQKYITEDELDEVRKRTDVIEKKSNKLITYLNSCKK